MGSKEATDVINLSEIRLMIHDLPVYTKEEFEVENCKKLELLNSPLYINKEDKYEVEIDIIEPEELEEVEFTVHPIAGMIEFDEKQTGIFEISYYYTQLTNDAIISSIENALLLHDPAASWEDFPNEYRPYVQWLACASLLYTLASKWAMRSRTRVETVEVHDQQVASRYFDLARRMENRYYEACAGKVDVKELTRRDVRTGMLVPIAEEFYGEKEISK